MSGSNKCNRCKGFGCRCAGRCPECIDHSAGKHDKKSSPVKDFLDKKLKKNEFKFELVKNEQVNCPDCGQNIFAGNVFSACVCYGDCGKVFLKKTEKGVVIRFGKNWDVENIQMLLSIIRRNRG